jgi:hypothetical protein
VGRLIQGVPPENWDGDSADFLDFLRSVYELWVESEPQVAEQKVAFDNLIRVETLTRIYADCKRLGANPCDEIRRQYDSVARSVEERLLKLERLKKAVYQSEADESKETGFAQNTDLSPKSGGVENGEASRAKAEPRRDRQHTQPKIRISDAGPSFVRPKVAEQPAKTEPQPERPPVNPVFMIGSFLPAEPGSEKGASPKTEIQRDGPRTQPASPGSDAGMPPTRHQVAESPTRKEPQPEPAPRSGFS